MNEHRQSVQQALMPGLYWTMKESFIKYISGMPDGQMYGEDVAADGNGTFFFPLITAELASEPWRIEFGGTLRFTGHYGFLNVELTRPVIEQVDSKFRLSVTASKGQRPIVCFHASESRTEGGMLVFPAREAFLTPEGVEVFGDVYTEGMEFGSVQMIIPVPTGSSPRS